MERGSDENHFRETGFALCRFVCGTAILWAASIATAYSQAGSAGAISIAVADASGAAVPDVGLQLKDVTTNILQKGNDVNATGNFQLPQRDFRPVSVDSVEGGF